MRLVDFLISVANDPEQLASLKDDPQGFLADASDLTDEQRTVLLSQDPSWIEKIILYELGGELPDGAQIGVLLFGVIALQPSPDETA